MYSSLQGNRNVARILLKSTKNPNIKYNGTRELLLLAAERGFDDIVEALISRNGNITAVDKNGWNALHFSAKHGHISTVKLLINKSPIRSDTEPKFVDATTNNNETGNLNLIKVTFN